MHGCVYKATHRVDALAKDRVLRLSRREPVEEIIVDRVHEKLGAARVGRARVGHRQGAGLVGQLRRKLVLDVAAVGARLRRLSHQILERPVWRAARTRTLRLGVLGIRAAELVHEIGDHAVDCTEARGRKRENR